MRKGYVIVETDYEYNDNIDVANGNGLPHTVFFDEVKAKTVCEEMNAKKFRGLNLRQYCYSLSELLNWQYEEDEAEQKLKELVPRLDFSDTYNENSTTIPNNTSLKKLKEIAKICSELNFYSVYEVNVED